MTLPVKLTCLFAGALIALLMAVGPAFALIDCGPDPMRDSPAIFTGQVLSIEQVDQTSPLSTRVLVTFDVLSTSRGPVRKTVVLSTWHDPVCTTVIFKAEEYYAVAVHTILADDPEQSVLTVAGVNPCGTRKLPALRGQR